MFINLFLLVDPAAGDAADESGSSAPPRQQSLKTFRGEDNNLDL